MSAKKKRLTKLEITNIAVNGKWYNSNVSDDEIYSYLSIARQLCYPVEVQDAIKNAKSDLECERILVDARNKY